MASGKDLHDRPDGNTQTRSAAQDHRATFSEWILETKRNTNAKPKKTFDRADWEKIEMEVLSLMGGQGELHSTEALDATVEKLTTTIASTVDKNTPEL
ncbi:hypothetical protein N7472_009684 [Penicillium cf. griseofulvum]|uniref:Uncharacterized protein n=1 Tax=Penicillium cf. griseofulvum TaxID=2972120 RepID=A0A9W9ITM2_9EURO|nr:hypothetical protein N7472_009684 [Penicillium cf. griseofulvum]KAJ5435959.1 hypothetical protein N7445_006844 [Penicillium cf. griseofulvum]